MWLLEAMLAREDRNAASAHSGSGAKVRPQLLLLFVLVLLLRLLLQLLLLILTLLLLLALLLSFLLCGTHYQNITIRSDNLRAHGA